MRLRLIYACVCGNTFETLHHDNKLAECSCEEKIWPVEIRHVGKEEPYKPSNDVKPCHLVHFAAIQRPNLPRPASNQRVLSGKIKHALPAQDASYLDRQLESNYSFASQLTQRIVNKNARTLR